MSLTRPITHNQNTDAPNAVFRHPDPAWFTNRRSSGSAHFAPPKPVGIRDTNGDYITLLAPTPESGMSNPRTAGKNRIVQQQLTTTIFR